MRYYGVGADFRGGMRRQITGTVHYSVAVPDLCELKRIHDIGMCSDMGVGGLCMTTGYPLEKGHVLTFEDQIRDEIPARFAIVKWVSKIGDNSYRAGMKFV